MKDRNQAAVAAIQERWAVTATPKENGIHLEFEGIPETFVLSTEHDEFTIFTDTWHEHFCDMERLLGFLDVLFTGTIQIVVKYRGKVPVSHKAQILKDGKVKVISRTGSLVSPFWWPKSYKTLKYTLPEKEPR